MIARVLESEDLATSLRHGADADDDDIVRGISNPNRARLELADGEIVAYTDDGSSSSVAAPGGTTVVTAIDGSTTPVNGPVPISGTPVRIS